MIKFKYIPGWDTALKDIFLQYDKAGFKVNQKLLSEGGRETPLRVMSDILKDNTNNNCLQTLATVIIQYVINAYEDDDQLQGLFNTLDLRSNRVSPFLGAHDYCVKVLKCYANGEVAMNISPIYRFGPDYPEKYKSKTGKTLNRDAIIGLLEDPAQGEEANGNKMFSLGIDAGLAFNECSINHNRELRLKLAIVEDGIMTNLTCQDQTTARKFTWETLGVQTASCNDRFEQKCHSGWAA